MTWLDKVPDKELHACLINVVCASRSALLPFFGTCVKRFFYSEFQGLSEVRCLINIVLGITKLLKLGLRSFKECCLFGCVLQCNGYVLVKNYL